MRVIHSFGGREIRVQLGFGLFVLVALSSVSACSRAEPAVEISVASPTVVAGPSNRAVTFASLPEYRIAGVTLHAPIRITRAEMFMDGGSTLVVLVDSEGTNLYTGVPVDHELTGGRRPFAERQIWVGLVCDGQNEPLGRERLRVGDRNSKELVRVLKDCIDLAAAEGRDLVEPLRPRGKGSLPPSRDEGIVRHLIYCVEGRKRG